MLTTTEILLPLVLGGLGLYFTHCFVVGFKLSRAHPDKGDAYSWAAAICLLIGLTCLVAAMIFGTPIIYKMQQFDRQWDRPAPAPIIRPQPARKMTAADVIRAAMKLKGLK
jgi:hypothetical protein